MRTAEINTPEVAILSINNGSFYTIFLLLQENRKARLETALGAPASSPALSIQGGEKLPARTPALPGSP